MSMEQLQFFLDEEQTKPVALSRDIQPSSLNKIDLRQSVLAFLLTLNPTALALKVPVKNHRLIISAGAVTCKYQASTKCNVITETIGVDIFTNRSDCLPACSNYNELALQLAELEEQKLAMEELIKVNEPELKISSDLFADELEVYEYKDSQIYPYLPLIKQIERTRQAMYKGSKMELIRQSNTVDRLYLAVPENLIQKHELAPGWGLIYIYDNHQFKIIQEAPSHSNEVMPELRNHFLLNIARSSSNQVLFANGVRLNEGDSPTFTEPPRRRRKIRS